MATDRTIVVAMEKAAGALVERQLTADERQRLVEYFDRAEGTYRQRAIIALSKISGFSQERIDQKRAASDNTDRVFDDLEALLGEWKPRT